ncbi:MAG: hypothetical protein BroJett022_15590 [Actinomycetes bacterium]|nr:MAG: hypothetical protein BroJett022_15590 [Actinomycetes bacterium]
MIIKRNNRYGVRIYRAGRQQWVGTYPTRREARQAERLALDSPVATHDETCDSFARRWLTDYPRPRAATNRNHSYGVAPFARDFQGVKLSAVTRRDARQWALRHRSNLASVRAMFTDAMDEGIVAANPFSNLRLEQSRGRRDLEVISEAQLDELADAALRVCGDLGATIRATILFAAYVGLRPAEMFVLRWSDVDFGAGLVRIRASLGGTGEVTLPKNGKARTVVLPPAAADALRSMPRRAESPLVFTTTRGTRFTKTTHYHHWRLARLAAGLPEMDFYELRHFCATQLLELGLSPADVAVQLGHTDGGALVMSTYGHPSEDAARQRIADAFDRARSPGLRVVGGSDQASTSRRERRTP